MFKLIICFCITGVIVADHISYIDYKVYNVTPNDLTDIDYLKEMDSENGINFWDTIHRSLTPIRVMVSPIKQNDFEHYLNEKNISYEIIIKNVENVFAKERAINTLKMIQIAQQKMEGKLSFDFDHFWKYEEVNEFLYTMADKYSKIASVETLGKTYEGRDLNAIKISLNGNVDGKNQVILVDALIHAREWIATMVAVNLIRELVENSENNHDILEGIDWVIVPILNPDGYVYSHNKDRMWRKTRSINSNPSCVGVDPNRNFDFKWDTPNGASDSMCSESYRGTKPASEIEVALEMELMRRYKNARVSLSIHSYGQYLLYPYGYGDPVVNVGNQAEHIEVGQRAKDAIYAINKTKYTLGNSAAVLYMASGGSDDYAVAEGHVDIGFTMELPGGGSSGFDIPASRIEAVVFETFVGIREFGKYVAEKWVNK